MTLVLDPTRGDELLAVSRDVNRFFPLLETLERDGKSPEVLASWMRISANYCADTAAAAAVTIVATRTELGPEVQNVLRKFGRAATPAARSKVWARVSPDVELALSVMMSAAVTITDRTWFERGEDGQAFVANMLLTCVSSADRARGVTSLRIIADRAEGSVEEPIQLHDPSPRPYELSEYMATDEPLPPRDTQQWAIRVVRAAVSGQTLLLHYLTSINDREIDVPNTLMEPRKASESAESYAQRERMAKMFVDVHVQLADHAPDVAEELLHIRPSDAQDAVEAITREAQERWTAAKYDATIDDLLPEMTVLLDGLVAPERRGGVQDLLEVVTSGGGVPLARAQLRICGAAADQPFEALHLAAAFTAALWQEPACVPDPNAEYLRLVTAAMRLSQGKFDSPRAASTSTVQPSAPARKADARKKAARKTAKRSRRQGRR